MKGGRGVTVQNIQFGQKSNYVDVFVCWNKNSKAPGTFWQCISCYLLAYNRLTGAPTNSYFNSRLLFDYYFFDQLIR